MASFNVQDNAYYKPPTGKNWIADRLIAAMQSFSAPKGPVALDPGQSGPPAPGELPFKPAGFGSALLGNDANRMNQAHILRRQDIEAARTPFEAEVGADTAQEGLRFGNAQALQGSSHVFQQQQAERENERALQAQRNRESFDLQRDQNRQIFDKGQALLRGVDEERAARRLFEQQQALRAMPTGEGEAQRQFDSSRPVQLGGSSFALSPNNKFSIYTSPKSEFGPQDPKLLPTSVNFNNPKDREFLLGPGQAQPANQDPSRTVDGDMQQLYRMLGAQTEDVLNKPKVPLNINYSLQ